MSCSFKRWIAFDPKPGPSRNFTRLKSERARLLVKRSNHLHPICNLLLPRNDLSFAIIPYAPSGKYYYHLDGLRVGEVEKVVNLKSDGNFASNPKLQFHGTGQVHVSAQDTRVAKVWIPSLRSWRGQHIATVDLDDLSSLPAPQAGGQKSARVLDQPFQLPAEWRAVRLVIFANGEKPEFSGSCPLVFAATCSQSGERGERLFLGIDFREHSPRCPAGGHGGITVIGGWDPDDGLVETSLVTLRGA
jgi:hypothetical protein